MALTKKDLVLIKELISDQLIQERQHLHGALDQQARDIKRDIRDEMDSRFSAFRNEIRDDMRALEERIHADVLHLVSDNILPAIDRAYAEIGAIRHFVGMT